MTFYAFLLNIVYGTISNVFAYCIVRYIDKKAQK